MLVVNLHHAWGSNANERVYAKGKPEAVVQLDDLPPPTLAGSPGIVVMTKEKPAHDLSERSVRYRCVIGLTLLCARLQAVTLDVRSARHMGQILSTCANPLAREKRLSFVWPNMPNPPAQVRATLLIVQYES